MTLHVVGNICVDTNLTVPRFPAPGETLVALASRVGLGGKGLNQAVAAARAGAEVVLHAAIGEADRSGAERALAGEPRLTLRLVASPLPSDTSMVLVRPDGENLIVSATACARGFDPWGVIADCAVAAGDHLLMQGNLSRAATHACLQAAKRCGFTTVLNPSPLWDAPPDWAAIDCVVLNAGELRSLSGEVEPAAGARWLLARGASSVAVTLGRHGALLIDATCARKAAAPAVEARDTSGAGDVFCGVFVALIAGGTEPDEALARATAAASLSVTRDGALRSCPKADELAALPIQPPSRSPS